MALPPEIDHQVVAALLQFRMAATEQLRVLHTPGSKLELMRRRLRKLKDAGLVEDVVLPQAGRLRAWFLTEHGVRIAATFPELEALWAVHGALVRARDCEPGTKRLHELLVDMTKYQGLTPAGIVDDFQRILTVLTLDLPAVRTVAAVLLLDQERDQAFHVAYEQITTAWQNTGINP